MLGFLSSDDGISLSQFMPAGGDTKSVLALKVKEADSLRAELATREVQNQELLGAQSQYQDMIEAQEAELARVREGTSNAVNAGAENEQKVKDLEAKVKEQEEMIALLSSRARADPFKLDIDDTGFQKFEGPKAFRARLDKMVQGEALQMWDKDKFVPVFLSISPDFKELKFAPSDKKPAKTTFAIDDIQRVSYPVRTNVKKLKKGTDLGKDYMKFSLETADYQTYQILTTEQSQLTQWVIGLQRLAAKPGQGVWNNGHLLWTKIRARLAVEADEKGLNPNSLLVETFSKMAQEKEEEAAVEAEQAKEEEGGDVEGS